MIKKFLKIALSSILVAIVVGLFWYFLKPYDYTVSLNFKTLPGAINQTLKSWSATHEDSEITSDSSFLKLKQQLTIDEASYLYDWELTPISDSLTKLDIGILDTESSFGSRFSNLFQDTEIKKHSEAFLKEFITLMDDHIDSFDVAVEGESVSPSTYCAYVSVKAKQIQKAKGMLQNYGLLSSVLLKAGVELNGRPMLDITKWDFETDSIHYDFCFPIVKQDVLPNHPKIKYKQIDSKKALKAVYHGNYLSSDRAWYALLNYAERNSIPLEFTPVEVYHNNPTQGADDRHWKTEIYLPIQQE